MRRLHVHLWGRTMVALVTRNLALMIFVLTATAHVRAEGEIQFLEKFALAANREVVLQELVPATEDYFFFHALHYQNSGQREKLETILADWKKRFENSATRKIIERRQALISYPEGVASRGHFSCARRGRIACACSLFQWTLPHLPLLIEIQHC